MRNILLLIAAAFLLGLVSCEKDPQGNEVSAAKYALDAYWADDYDGKLGIQVSEGATPMMTLAGEPLFVTGINCYNLFNQSISASMSVSEMEATVAVLIDQEVPVVRFNCGIYHASELTRYFDQKEQYFANLTKLAQLCDQAHILLVPSVFWQIATLPGYYSE